MRYLYRCPKCSNEATLRRLIEEMDDPAECLNCGQPMERQFTPTTNIHIPLHFRQFHTGGQPAGGGLSWSDFHDETEKELAKNDWYEPSARLMSKPGHGREKPRRKRDANAPVPYAS